MGFSQNANSLKRDPFRLDCVSDNFDELDMMQSPRVKNCSHPTYRAARRYLRIYQERYRGPPEQLERLKNKCEAYIFFLRRAAPTFYEKKLPKLIHQVASIQNGYDTNTQEGRHKFNQTHAVFLMILTDLRLSQPVGDVDFFLEKKRFNKRNQHQVRYNELVNKIAELEATEFDPDELGLEDDQAEDRYTQVFHELETLRNELKRVALEIAFLHGEPLEDEIEFHLNIRPNQQLFRLTDEQKDLLESQLAELYRKNYKKRDAFVDKSMVDEMIERLGIDQSLFKKVDIHDMACEALEAYKSYRRMQEQERISEYYSVLLEKEQLKPKCEIEIKHPDDIPMEVRKKLDDIDRTANYAIQTLFKEFGEKPNVEDSTGVGDEEDSNDGIEDIVKTIKTEGQEFARVKEELPDEYEMGQQLLGNMSSKGSQEAPESTPSTSGQQKQGATHRSTNASVGTEPPSNVISFADSSDDDVMCLGTIEPKDKVKHFNIE